MKEAKKIIGKNIRKIRKVRGMTQFVLSEASGISRSYIGDLENGRRHSMSIDTLQKLADKLDVSIFDLLEGIE